MWLLVLNRSSGKGKISKKFLDFKALCDAQNIRYQVIDENSAELTEDRFQRELSSGKFEVVVAFGGDGLISLCLQKIVRSDIGLTVVPTGTGNDFARSIGTYGKSTEEIFSSIFNSNKTKIDVALCENNEMKRYFVQVLSIGFDATVNRFANSMKYPKGKIKYTIAMLLLLPRAKDIDFEIKQGPDSLKIKSMLVAVANGSSYGGGMKILPNASFRDGLLDLLYVDPVSKLTLLSIFPRVFRGTHTKHPAVHLLQSRNFEVAASTDAYADGEYAGVLPIKLSVIKDGLTTWICK
ncbi:MAG: diacylglycerol kinase family protein [Actinomycetes bacterium]